MPSNLRFLFSIFFLTLSLAKGKRAYNIVFFLPNINLHLQKFYFIQKAFFFSRKFNLHICHIRIYLYDRWGRCMKDKFSCKFLRLIGTDIRHMYAISDLCFFYELFKNQLNLKKRKRHSYNFNKLSCKCQMSESGSS